MPVIDKTQLYMKEYDKQKILRRKEMHLCNVCGKNQPIEGVLYCSDCQADCSTSTSKKNLALKLETFVAYGGCHCSCPGCNITEIKFLTMDHINDDGAQHRHNNKERIYRYLKRHNFPGGYQVLCMNCNLGRYINGGICPRSGVDHSS